MNKISRTNIPAWKVLKKYSGTLLTLVLLSVVLSIATDSYLQSSNMINILRQVSCNAIISFGMTYLLICGSIDLSVGSVCALSGVTLITLVKNGCNFYLALLCALLTGLLSGLVNGLLVAKLKVPAFIATLATQFGIRGFAYLISNNSPVRVDSDAVFYFGNGSLFGIPNTIYYLVIIAVITGIILSKTRFGRQMYATGGNEEAAIHSGINTKKVIIAAHVICSLLAAFVGVIWASRVYSGQPTLGSGFEGDAIAAAVLGGTSFSGGVGTIAGTVLGALIIGVIDNGLNLMQASYAWQLIVKGLVIAFSVYIDIMRKKRSMRA